jgi:virginiamycin B lyase
MTVRRLIAVVGVSVVALGFAAVAASALGSAPAVEEYRLPDAEDIPAAIALAPDGGVWFTLESSDAVGVLRNGVIHKVPRGGETVEALGLAVASDGGVWVTDISGQSIRRLSLDGTRDSVRVPGPLAQLGRLAVAPDGAVWFADSWGNSISRLDAGHLSAYAAAEPNAAPFGVAIDARGYVWATLQIANKLMRIDPDGGVTELDLPTRNATPTDIAIDASGGIWFTELRANKIGHFADGRFTETSLPNNSAGLTSLATGPDGSVWFTELRRQSLARLMNGSVTEFTLPRQEARPFAVTVSASGDVWYTDLSGRVGRLPAERARANQLNLERILAWLRG